jgi:hypothetical protein
MDENYGGHLKIRNSYKVLVAILKESPTLEI